MCVIFACQRTKPTADQISKGYDANSHGAGIAWLEGQPGERVVRWKKGLSKEEVTKLSDELSLPQILHFRIPSVGPDKPQFCHPFPITQNAELSLEGKTKGRVLFHNGTWGNWRPNVVDWGLKSGTPLPMGKWSDSRGLAFAAYCVGLGILEFIDERVAIMGPEGINVFNANGWSKVADGFWASNMGWNYKIQTSYTGSESDKTTVMGPAAKSAQTLLPNEEQDEDDEDKIARIAAEKAGGTSHPTGFCLGGYVPSRSVEAVSGGGDHKEGLPPSEGEVRNGSSADPLPGRRAHPTLKDITGLRAWVAGLNPRKYRGR